MTNYKQLCAELLEASVMAAAMGKAATTAGTATATTPVTALVRRIAAGGHDD